ncbi:hypothetical protein Rsub_01207 [Raphidocelis subcapitata]|uniref:Chitin-binding type-2 domain-containing protein n=1 Tax=Raphidocelis subcapitata TaxID=307507 RepID=A0A2V0NM17_9CHLO|nr:hypothetical protein Rsub_01207 [Raphidocelis subcapitata]|eukprot:GBF88494.1 hypothetical protein Rsub_01207 [Raphidocelis subcapitata]
MGAAGVGERTLRRQPAAARAVVPAALLLLLACRAADGAIVRSDNSALCQTNLAACERQCATVGGQYTFQCDSGGTFDRPTSTCQCVRTPTGLANSEARFQLVAHSPPASCPGQTWFFECAQNAAARVVGGAFLLGAAAPVPAAAAPVAAAPVAPAPALAAGSTLGAAASYAAPVPRPRAADGADDATQGVFTGSAATAARQQDGGVSAVGTLNMGGGAPTAAGAGAGFGAAGPAAAAPFPAAAAGPAAAPGFMGRRLQQLGAAAPGATLGAAPGATLGAAPGATLGAAAAPLPGAAPQPGYAAAAAAQPGYAAAAAPQPGYASAAAAAPQAAYAAAAAPAARGACSQVAQGVATSLTTATIMAPGIRDFVTARTSGNDTLTIQLASPACSATFKLVNGSFLALRSAPPPPDAAADAAAAAAAAAPNATAAAPAASSAGAARGAWAAAAAACAAALLSVL